MEVYVIPLKLPSCNEYINACRVNRYAGAKMKAETEESISWFLRNPRAITKPAIIEFEWQEPNRKRDLDGIAFAKKFILDALVKKGILPNDTQRWVRGYTDTFRIGDQYKVTITIKEIEQ